MSETINSNKKNISNNFVEQTLSAASLVHNVVRIANEHSSNSVNSLKLDTRERIS